MSLADQLLETHADLSVDGGKAHFSQAISLRKIAAELAELNAREKERDKPRIVVAAGIIFDGCTTYQLAALIDAFQRNHGVHPSDLTPNGIIDWEVKRK